ncbi:MAG TPA: GNAT family N-acetyltransferase [Steroidobacteraceae bacterium]|jgi:CelD/BcsL family acetyltransferase involved in cellulose biosynthesis
MTRAGSLSVRFFKSVRGWETLQSWWDGLLESSPDSTPWQSWDYLWSGWQRLGGDKELRLVVVERAGVPVMIFPLQLTREKLLGVPARIIEPLGLTSDVNRPRLALGAPDTQAFAVGLEGLWSLREEWDALRVDDLPLTDGEAGDLKAFAEEHRMWCRDSLSRMHAPLSLAQPWDEFLNTRSPALRENLRAALRNLAAEGVVQFEVSESPEDVMTAFNVVLGLQQRRGLDRKPPSFTASPLYREFFREFLVNMALKGHARVLILWAGDRPVAGAVAVLHRDTYFSTEIVHDAAFARCSPENLLVSFELERLMAPGLPRSYQFSGGFADVPPRWTDETRDAHHIYVFQSGLRSWVDRHYFRARPAVRRACRAVFGLSRGTAHATRFTPRT